MPPSEYLGMYSTYRLQSTDTVTKSILLVTLDSVTYVPCTVYLIAHCARIAPKMILHTYRELSARVRLWKVDWLRTLVADFGGKLWWQTLAQKHSTTTPFCYEIIGDLHQNSLAWTTDHRLGGFGSPRVVRIGGWSGRTDSVSPSLISGKGYILHYVTCIMYMNHDTVVLVVP